MPTQQCLKHGVVIFAALVYLAAAQPQIASSPGAAPPGTSQSQVITSFSIVAPGLVSNSTLASRTTEVLRQMLLYVLGPKAKFAANITAFLDTGNAAAHLNAIVPSDRLPFIITTGCCQQYAGVLQQLVGNPGLESNISLPDAYKVGPVQSPTGLEDLQLSATVTAATGDFTVVYRVVGRSLMPITEKVRQAVSSAMEQTFGDLGGMATVDDVKDSTTSEVGTSIDVYISVKHFNASQFVPGDAALDASLAQVLHFLKQQGFDARLLYLALQPAAPPLAPVLSPHPMDTPVQSPQPAFTSASTTPAATIQLQIRLIGTDALPFIATKQQSMLVATVSYLAALNISASQLKVIDFEEFPAQRSPPPSSGAGRRLQQVPAARSGGLPFVDVIVQMVLSGEDVYNLANSRGGQTVTASNSFDAVMAQQGIRVQSQLLGARTVGYGPPTGNAQNPSSPTPQATPSPQQTAPAGRGGSSCTGGGGAGCLTSQDPPQNPPPSIAQPLPPVPKMPAQTRTAPAPQLSTTFGTQQGSSKLSSAATAAIAVLVPVVVIMASGVVFMAARRCIRRRKRQRALCTEHPPLTASWMNSPPPTSSTVHPAAWTESPPFQTPSTLPPSGSLSRNSASAWGDFAWVLNSKTHKSMGKNVQMSTSAQTHETALAEVVVFVVTHLPSGAFFKNRFVLGSERWRSSTCLMCAAKTQGPGDQQDVLLKFFASDADFDREVAVAGQFQSLFPVVFGVFPANFDDPEYDEDRVPACIAIERPICTLQEWLAQSDIDWLLSDQIATLYCIASMLKEMHAKDLILCDLSPTTIAWFDSGDKPPGWRLLSASQASHKGRHVRPVSHMRFAAPEVALSFREAQNGYVLVSPSIDVWALGIIGLGVFGGRNLFGDSHTEEQIRLMLCNEEPLPFELDRGWWDCIQPPAVAGLLRNLLQRKPLLRMTVDDVLRVIQTLATAPPRLPVEVRVAERDADSEAGTSRMESATEVGMQLSPYPTTWSMNFSDRLLSMSGGGSELNTEEQIIGRHQAMILNAQLSANLGADLLDSQPLP